MRTFPRSRWALRLIALITFALGHTCCWGRSTNSVDVVLWFDTEDYLLPADDDAGKRLAEMLTARGVRATFKVVGEKARTLERRGRRDVIEALNRHDIGYHANWHSVHPTPSEYLADCGLLDGMGEFIRREGGGAEDVRRIFGVSSLSCYGQPGSSWGSQALAALKQIGVAPHGVACYVDEGDHVGLNEQPFWFAGALVVYHMGRNWTRMELHDPQAVQPAKEQVSAIVHRLSSHGGGLISIFYHPCEWVHQEFWDGVNFRRGANPPREEWKAPPQRPAAETEGAFERFGEYIDYIRTLPDVRFVTAGDLPRLYPDPIRERGAIEEDLTQLAQAVKSAAPTGLDFHVVQSRAYSLADQFQVLAEAVQALGEGRRPRFPMKIPSLLGPDAPPPVGRAPEKVSRAVFREALRDAIDYLKREQRVPARVFIGADPVAPSDFLAALALVWLESGSKQDPSLPEFVRLPRHVSVLSERYIADDTPGLFGGWIIHKEGFRAPKILEVARWQTWTLKPAIRALE